MPRPATGQVVEKTTQRGTVYALRFRAYGQRRYVTLGSREDGWDHKRAETELRHVLADVERGTWQPADAAPVVEVKQDDPTFHVFASEWLASRRGELRESTLLDYEWQLTHHLLPFFAGHRLSQITIAEIDRYRHAQVREADRRRAVLAAWQKRCEALSDGADRPRHPGPALSATSINKTITRLGQILEQAVEYDLIARNPARIGKRKLKTSRARRAYLDDAEQIVALLDAAGELDRGAREDRSHIARRTLLATLAFSGLRIGELLALRWRDVDLAGGRLHVTGSKTDTGVRDVTLLPVLRDELATHRARSRHTAPDAFVFATRDGRRQSEDNLRTRVLARAIDVANERREAADLTPLPVGLTFHSLRHTFVSALFALGHELPVVMAEVGHSDPSVTLGIYAHVMRRGPEAKDALRALVSGAEWAPMGTTADSDPRTPARSDGSDSAKAPR